MNLTWHGTNVTAGGYSACGPNRDVNQDQYLLAELSQVLEVTQSTVSFDEDHSKICGALFLVADGVGGRQKGEIASQEALLGATRQLAELCACKCLPMTDPVAMQALLFKVVDDAQKHLETLADGDIAKQSMATTLSLLCLLGKEAFLVYVGDSRTFYYENDGTLQQVSRDQTEAQRLIDQESIPVAEAEARSGHVLLEALAGHRHEVHPGWWHCTIQPGDRFLICTDGVTGFMSMSEIEQTLASSSAPDERARNLVETAHAAGGHDDATAIVIQLNQANNPAPKDATSCETRRLNAAKLDETQPL